uniref:Uncharacterized protein n=1 Tax=Xiphophorus couchianus TaxID=32473 RepID=A0A3B5MBL2_9TELE
MESGNNYVFIHGKNISHNTLAGSAAGPHMSIDKLFPALLECFGIILCGYIAGRADMITESQAKGLGNFVSKFALPALLFKNMVLLDFGDVIWAFLWSILVAKVTVFVLVCVLTLIVASPDNRYSKAGLYAIFATQSNDFALGYPIVDALYRSTYPEYLQYIYLVAPVSLMLLNPIGFALCEVQRWRQASHLQHRSLGILGIVVLQVLKNPIVFMVIVGIISHFALGERIPFVLSEFIDGLANSFGGAALFYLGLTMIVSFLFFFYSNNLVMPLVCKDMVDILDVGVNSTSPNHTSLSNFAFLYGVFPTAPSVAIYAVHYNMELEVVTSGMVISTFLSAPIMYVSAWLLTIPFMDPSPLVAELENVSFNISIISLIGLFLVCVSMILWNFLVKQEDNFLSKVLTFTLLYGSLYSTYIWTGLYFILSLVCFCRIPFVMVGLLLISGERTETLDSAFFYALTAIFDLSLRNNLSSCLWWLFNKDPGRLYLELQFFCAVANYGQGFLSFGIFGLDKHLIIVPFKKRFLSLWHSRDGEDPSPSAVPEDVRLTCTQFVRYHKDQCVQDIVHTHRYEGHSVFRGSDLVDWLTEQGLCARWTEAKHYGVRQQSFRDEPTLTYYFLQEEGWLNLKTGRYAANT